MRLTPGMDFGYTWPFALRIGTDASYGFGRSEETSDGVMARTRAVEPAANPEDCQERPNLPARAATAARSS